MCFIDFNKNSGMKAIYTMFYHMFWEMIKPMLFIISVSLYIQYFFTRSLYSDRAMFQVYVYGIPSDLILPITFYVGLFFVIAIYLWKLNLEYQNPKTIYTWATLPGCRGYVIFSRFLSIVLCVFLFICIEVAFLLFLQHKFQYVKNFNGTFFKDDGTIVRYVNEYQFNTGLFIVFIKNHFLRHLFPLNKLEQIHYIFQYTSILSGITTLFYCEKTGVKKGIRINYILLQLCFFLLLRQLQGYPVVYEYVFYGTFFYAVVLLWFIGFGIYLEHKRGLV